MITENGPSSFPRDCHAPGGGPGLSPARNCSNTVPDDGVLQLLRRHERSPAGPDEAGYAVAALQHVVQVQPIILHSGVASRRILSRTYQ